MMRLIAWPAAGWLVLLAACAGPGGRAPDASDARANAATAAACRERADQVYDVRHRETIYGGPSGANTPFSANYTPSVPDRGLAQIFEHDNVMRDCVRNTGAQGDRTPTVDAPALNSPAVSPPSLNPPARNAPPPARP